MGEKEGKKAYAEARGRRRSFTRRGKKRKGRSGATCFISQKETSSQDLVTVLKRRTHFPAL